jgi:competence protein ComEC
LGKRRAFWVAVAGVAVYAILVGASPAVVRAAIMGVISLLALRLGRETYAPASLAAAAFVMTVWDPDVLWDVGFQLSFAATIGLVLYTEPLEQFLERVLARATSPERAQAIVSSISEALLATVAAEVTILPVILYHFGRLSLITLVSNLLVLPVQSYLMLAGGLATLLGLALRPLGQVVGWIAWVFLTYTIEIVRLTARVRGASVPVRTDGWMVFVYYMVLGCLTWWLAQPQERRYELRSRLSSRLQTREVIGVAFILLILAFCARQSLPDGRLHVMFLDVGQGDAIFIQTPSGRQILVDGGPSEPALLSQLGRQMGFWDRTLDVMVLTHPDTDHVTGLVGVLERYQVDMVIFRDLEIDSDVYAHWKRLLESEGADIYQGEAGLHLVLDRGLEMMVLHPGADLVDLREENTNNHSIVTRLTYGAVSVLLPGDIEAEVERQLVEAHGTGPVPFVPGPKGQGRPVQGDASLRSTVLKAAHHGSCTSTTEGFLEAVDPEIVVISVGEENDFGHPCAEVLQRLAELSVYRTDVHGTVEVITDGAQVWVEVQRGD